jgi:hypothetical protein
MNHLKAAYDDTISLVKKPFTTPPPPQSTLERWAVAVDEMGGLGYPQVFVDCMLLA